MNEKKVLMFAGKGGVGKTTCAGATALHYARRGEKTLLISTDPTPSLSHLFEVERARGPTKVAENLYLAELGPTEIRQMWERKFGPEVYEVFSSFVDIGYEEFTDFVTSILPGLGEEFMVDYIRELSHSADYERLIWDTAPLGQTLGLLRMPALLRQHLRAAPRIYSRLKFGERSRRPLLEILKSWEELSALDIEFLRHEVSFWLVTIPEGLAVQQLQEILSEFEKFGFKFTRLIINNVVQKPDSEFLLQKAAEQNKYLVTLRQNHEELRPIEVPLFPHEIKGMGRLEEVRQALFPDHG